MFVRRLTRLSQPVARTKTYKRFSFNSGGLEVDSVGSAARDHLANERTFLAWARTSLVFVGSGVGLHQFYQYALPYDTDEISVEKERKQQITIRNNVIAASSVLVTIGGGILSFAATRYFAVLKAINRNKFIPNTQGVAAFVVCTGIIISIALVSTLKFNFFIFESKEPHQA